MLLWALFVLVEHLEEKKQQKKNLRTDVSPHVKDARADSTEALKTSSVAIVDLASMETVLHSFASENVSARTLTSFVRTRLRLADGILVLPVSHSGEMDVYLVL